MSLISPNLEERIEKDTEVSRVDRKEFEQRRGVVRVGARYDLFDYSFFEFPANTEAGSVTTSRRKHKLV